MDSLLRTGALANHSPVTLPTIRYDQQIGLIPAARPAFNGRLFKGGDSAWNEVRDPVSCTS